MKLTTLIILACLLVLTSCYRDVEEQLYPGGSAASCDTSSVTYAATIAPLLQNNGCISCHSGGAPSAGISLQTYAQVRSVAQNGKLYGAINHSPGFSAMPKGGNKMNACAISRIKSWIDAGAINN